MPVLLLFLLLLSPVTLPAQGVPLVVDPERLLAVDAADDGLPPGEGAFGICSFWAVTAQALALPGRVIPVLDRQLGQRRRPALAKRCVERRQLLHQHPHGPAVRDDVVHGEEQGVLPGREAQEDRAQERPAPLAAETRSLAGLLRAAPPELARAIQWGPALPARRALPGPAFLVSRNFNTIYRYNNSERYVMEVALLATRIAGGPGFFTPWPTDDPGLTRAQVREQARAVGAREHAGEVEHGDAVEERGGLTRPRLRARMTSVSSHPEPPEQRERADARGAAYLDALDAVEARDPGATSAAGDSP